MKEKSHVCRQLFEAHVWWVVEEMRDEAIGGASHLRPGFQRLHKAVPDRICDVILAEALDRLSRDQEHMAGLYKRPAYHEVRIVTRSEGEIDKMRISFGGLMSSQFIKQLSEKTGRGLEDRQIGRWQQLRLPGPEWLRRVRHGDHGRTAHRRR